jgi:predicted protein tyrosine phosphatase
MKFVVCPFDDVEEIAVRYRPDALVSLLAPDQPTPPAAEGLPWLLLRFHDIPEPQESLIAPDAAAMARLLEFAAGRAPAETVLVHCWMGVSRSTAAAFILACAAAPTIGEDDIAWALRRAAPTASPNPLMVSLADAHLRRGGRMIEAVSRIGRGREASRGEPFELDTNRLAPSP